MQLKNGDTEVPPHTIVNKITTEIERTKRTIYRTNIEKVFKKTKTNIYGN